MSNNPLYQQLYLRLKKLIRSGEYEVGSFLPTEEELQQEYNVSRTTVRKAIAMLASEGYVEVTRGRGTQVLDFRYTQNLNHVTSTSEALRRKGHTVTARSVFVDEIEADEKRSKTLGIPLGTKIYRIQRVQLADNVPIAIMENYLDVRIAPNLKEEASLAFSLYNTLEKSYGIHLDSVQDFIGAKTADFYEAELLGVKVGAALLVIRRVAFSAGKPISYDKATMRADRFEFEIASAGRKYF